MRLAVLKERRADETRVAATPETVRKLVALGLEVAVEAGAGAGASMPDADFTAAGATVAPDAAAALAGAGIVFAVRPPEPSERSLVPRGALLVCTAGAVAERALVPALAQAGIDTAAMELLPRITRAQSMDVLSSQANLAGYRAVIEGAGAFDRGFAMMMTAAGTVPPARVFVLGAGVAGLQAIATARRLGAIVSATDVRPAAKEEIRSLGATFVGVEDEETAGQTGAYAREMSAEFRRKQAELVAATVAKNDLVICTALVQGGRAPTLVTQAMVDGMRPGSVVVDLAADGGGNCEATRPGELFVTPNGVKILGFRNWPGRIPVAASTLYAKNLLTFLTTFWDKDAKAPKLPPDDPIVAGVMLTRGGAVVHPQFAGDAPPAPAPAPAPAGAAEQDASPSLADPSASVVPPAAGASAPDQVSNAPPLPETNVGQGGPATPLDPLPPAGNETSEAGAAALGSAGTPATPEVGVGQGGPATPLDPLPPALDEEPASQPAATRAGVAGGDDWSEFDRKQAEAGPAAPDSAEVLDRAAMPDTASPPAAPPAKPRRPRAPKSA